MDWHSIGTRLAKDWHSIGTRLAKDWPSSLTSDWQRIDNGLEIGDGLVGISSHSALDWHRIGDRSVERLVPDWHSIDDGSVEVADIELATDWQWIGDGLALD